MERQKLTETEILENLNKLENWTAAEDKLARKYKFKNFAESLAFINKAGAIAEHLDHHPDILFGWGYAEFFITTHEAGGITEKDFALAKEIEGIASREE